MFQDFCIQKFDGTAFTNVDIDSDKKYDLSQITDVSKIDGGNIQILFEEKSKGSLLIKPGSNIATMNTSKPIGVSNNKGITQEILDQDSLAKQILIADKYYYAFNGGIWCYEKEKLKKLFGNENKAFQCWIFKKDQNDNLIAFFGQRPSTTEALLVYSTKDEKAYDFEEILSYNQNIKDVYAENVFDKWCLATYNGLMIVKMAKDGIYNYEYDKYLGKSQFGKIITSVNTQNDKVLFLRENFGILSLSKGGIVNETFKDKAVFFHSNQKMVFDEISNYYYSYSYRYDGKSDLNIFDSDFKNFRQVVVPFKLKDIELIDGELMLLGYQESKSSNKGLIAQLSNDKQNVTPVLDDISTVNCLKKIGNEIWVGTNNGILIYTLDWNLIKDISKEIVSHQEYLDRVYISMIGEYNEKVFVGSLGGGIHFIDKQTKEISHTVSSINGLSNDIAISALEDDAGFLWIGTFNGLNVLNQQFELVKKYFEFDGLPNREFNTKAAAKTKKGTLLFGTINGLLEIDPVILLNSSESSGVHINDIEYLNHDNTRTSIDFDKTISVSSDIKSLILKFNQPDYVKNSDANTAQKLLVKSDSKLNYSLQGKSIFINDLEVGEHQLSFTNSAGQFKDSIRIKVYSDYWDLLLPILGVICLALFFFLLSRFRVAEMRKKEEQKTKINKQIAELELTALRSQMNPHFIFNALGAIQYFIQTQKTDKADDYLSDFAQLMRSILESSKSKYISLAEEVKILELYTKLEKIRFVDLFEYQILIDDGIDMENYIPPMIIQPFLENAINHGLHNLKDRKGQLTISFDKVSENEIAIVVEDNGVGRDASSQIRKLKKHKSRGMEIVQDRIKTIKAQGDMEISLDIQDLKDEQGIALGTKVCLLLKYNE